MYDRYKDDRIIFLAATKIIEDRIDYKKIQDVGRFLRAIKNPGSGTAPHIARSQIKLYYAMTADYLLTKNYRVYVQYIFSPKSIEVILGKIEEIKKDKELIALLSQVADKILP